MKQNKIQYTQHFKMNLYFIVINKIKSSDSKDTINIYFMYSVTNIFTDRAAEGGAHPFLTTCRGQCASG